MKDIYMKELSKLATGLMKRNISFSFTAFMNGGKIDWGTCDAICHDGSYGRQDGLLEIMGAKHSHPSSPSSRRSNRKRPIPNGFRPRLPPV